MAKFAELAHFERPLDEGYKPLPFRFMQLSGDDYVLTNLAGEFAVAPRDDVEAFARGNLSWRSQLYSELKSKHFLIDKDSDVALDLLALKLRTIC